MHKLPNFLLRGGKEAPIPKSLVEDSKQSAVVLHKLPTYSKEDLVDLIVLEIKRDESRASVLNRLYPRLNALVKADQWEDIVKCANLK